MQNGDRIAYNKLVSTVPLNYLIANSDLSALQERLSKLVYTSVYTVNIVFTGNVPDAHWMYFPDPDLCFYRISFPKNYFKNSTIGDKQILSIEVGSRDHSLNEQIVEEKVLSQIKKVPIFEIDEIHLVHSIKIPVAYCIYDHNRTKVVDSFVEELKQSSIYSIGRYGNWEYSAMQDAILYGKDLAQEFKEK
jgi:protoporphyrinogen oxidase